MQPTCGPVNQAVVKATGRAAPLPCRRRSSCNSGAGRALQELGAARGSGFLALLTQFGHLSQRPFLENGWALHSVRPGKGPGSVLTAGGTGCSPARRIPPPPRGQGEAQRKNTDTAYPGSLPDLSKASGPGAGKCF